MKLDFTGPEVEASGVTTQGKFGVDEEDMGFILYLLRNKIYSDIIRAIVQEYLSNARDAQRERGNADVPVQVTLPNVFEQSWKVRDFGNSIPPDRMRRVFIRYGKSTKRLDDLQTGGYGLGCKTGFGYGDTFSVNTFRGGVMRAYACIIDETRCGELVLLGESTTTEPDGTEIVIPVKRGDAPRFVQETARATEFWTVRPKIINGSVPWQDMEAEAVLKGSDWFVARNVSSHGSRIGILVDEIEYPFDEKHLLKNFPFRIGSNSRVYLKVGVGGVPVAANREQIEVDQTTKILVRDRLDRIAVEIMETFKKVVESQETFFKACRKLQECCNSMGMELPKDFEWNGMKLHGSEIYHFPGSFVTYYLGPKGNARKSNPYRFPVDEDIVYVTTTRDFDNVTENGATAILKAFPDKKSVCMVRWPKPETALEFEGFGFVQFSDYYTPKDRKAALGRLLFYKFNKSDSLFRRSSVAEFEADQNQKLWCQLEKRSYRSYEGPTNGALMLFEKRCGWRNNFNVDELLSFIAEDGVSLYGFVNTLPEDRVQAATEGLMSIEDAIRMKIAEENIDLGEVVFATRNNYENSCLFSSDAEREFVKAREEVPESSPFRKYLEESHAFAVKAKRYKMLGMLDPVFGVSSKRFDEGMLQSRKEMTEKYPMIKYVSTLAEGRYEADNVSAKDLFAYVALVDAAQ